MADFNISYSTAIMGTNAAAYFGGSLAYMSPEQLEAYNLSHERGADELDGRSDLYSLGVVLWELATGNRPFEDQSLHGDLVAVLASMTARRRQGVGGAMLAALPREAPAALREILMRCLAPDPADRFGSAGELARHLELALQPRVDRLLRPPPRGLSRAVRYAPMAALLAAGLAPNSVMSILNSSYNLKAIVERLGDPVVAELFLRKHLTVVNAIAYPICVTLTCLLLWPLCSTLGRMRRGEAVPLEQCARMRRRALRIGEYLSWISIAAWLATGVAFPIWIRRELNVAGSFDSTARLHGHFFMSELLSGVIAGSLVFFFATFLSVRFCYPRLVRVEAADPHARDIERLGRRVWVYFGLSVSTFFVAMMMVALVDMNHAAAGSMQAAYVIMAGGGLVCSVVSFRLGLVIRDDLAGLILVAEPTDDVLLPVGALGESLRTASRR